MGNGTDDETLIELIMDENQSSAISHGDFLSIGFAVDSIEVMLKTVKSKNIPIHSGPVNTPGAKFFLIKDPNGLNVQFFEQE